MNWIRGLFSRHSKESCRKSEYAHHELDQKLEQAQAERREAAQIRADAEKQGSRLRAHLEENNFTRRWRAALAADDRRERHA